MVLLLALHALAQSPAPSRAVVARFAHGAIDTGVIPDTLQVSPDQRSIAWVSRVEGGQVRVALDGRYGPLYDDVAVGTPLFSPNSQHLAYLARKGQAWHVVVGGKEGPALPAVLDHSLAFSPDSTELIVGVRAHEHWWTPRVEASRTQPANPHVEILEDLFDWISTPMQLTADGAPFFAARAGHQWVVVQRGERFDGWDRVEHTSLSTDGAHTAWVARDGAATFAVVDGLVSPPWEQVGARGVVFSADGDRAAYTARTRDGWWVVVDGVPVGPWDALGEDISFSPDSAHLAWSARTGDQWRVVVDGALEHLTARPLPGSLTLAPQGGAVAWAAPTDLGVEVIRDGDLLGTWEELLTPLHFSPDGAHLALGVRTEAAQAVAVDRDAHPLLAALLNVGGAGLRWENDREFSYWILHGDQISRVVERLSPETPLR